MASVQVSKSTPPNLGVTALANELPEYNAFKSTLLYSAGILFLPILSFFLSKFFVFDNIFALNLITSNVCSAICAILILHITLGAFIYKAYSGTDKGSKKD